MQYALINTINAFCQLIYILIMVRILLSWVPALSNTMIGRLVYQLTEPILGPIRSMIHNSPIGGGMMLDFSPVIALFIMQLIKSILINIILVF